MLRPVLHIKHRGSRHYFCDGDGARRRTADVKSVGYSELFVLSREDVLAAFKDHPEAEVQLMCGPLY